MHDLDAIAGGDAPLDVGVARHDLFVDLHGDARGGHAQILQQLVDADRVRELVRLAVHGDAHRKTLPASLRLYNLNLVR